MNAKQKIVWDYTEYTQTRKKKNKKWEKKRSEAKKKRHSNQSFTYSNRCGPNKACNPFSHEKRNNAHRLSVSISHCYKLNETFKKTSTFIHCIVIALTLSLPSNSRNLTIPSRFCVCAAAAGFVVAVSIDPFVSAFDIFRFWFTVSPVSKWLLCTKIWFVAACLNSVFNWSTEKFRRLFKANLKTLSMFQLYIVLCPCKS